MTNGVSVKRKFHAYRGRSIRRMVPPTAEPNVANGHPRISRLMALAIRFDQLIHDGVVADQAGLARLGHTSRARLTQIMNLLNLAPDIQEELLSRQSSEQGRVWLTERNLRALVAETDWRKQRRGLQQLASR